MLREHVHARALAREAPALGLEAFGSAVDLPEKILGMATTMAVANCRTLMGAVTKIARNAATVRSLCSSARALAQGLAGDQVKRPRGGPGFRVAVEVLDHFRGAGRLAHGAVQVHPGHLLGQLVTIRWNRGGELAVDGADAGNC